MEPTAQSQQKASPSSSAEELAVKLNAAVRDQDRETVLELLERGADVNSRAESGWTPLQSAVQADNEELVRLLLDKGACPHARKDNGGTAFTEAAMVGNVTILELLLDRGLNINDCDDNGFTAFMEAAWYGEEEALRFLHRRGAKVNLRREVSEEKAKLLKGGETALMDACKRGHVSIVKALVREMGADVNVRDNKDRNALIHALRDVCEKKTRESAASIGCFLLDCGVDVTSRDECGKTALILAAELQSLHLVKALLEKGEIDIDDADEEGKTALMVAVKRDDYAIAELLCERGARTDVGNLIEMANRNRAQKMSRLLRQYKARVVPDALGGWEPKSKRWREQLVRLHKIYRPMVGKLKTFQCIQQRIRSTSQGDIYLGLHGGTEVAVRISRSTQGEKEKMFFEQCGKCERLLKLFQVEAEKGDMFLCFPLWEKNLEEHLQEAEDQPDHKDALRMIFQAVRELHSLNFAHQDLRPSNFLIDLGGKIYLADLDNKRKLIEGNNELVNSDLEALGKLVLYVLTGGGKPLQEVCIEDLDADSPDYEEAVDLANSLASHDERGLEGLSRHPYFWSKQGKFQFLKSIWNKIKDFPSPEHQEAVFQAPNATTRFPYRSWTKKVDKEVMNIMRKPPGRRVPFKYKNNVVDLLRFIRNLDEHPHVRITEKIGGHATYFLKLFPALTIYVYNSLRQNPEYSHFADFQDPLL